MEEGQINARTLLEKADPLKFDSKDKKIWYSQQDETPPCTKEKIASTASVSSAELQCQKKKKLEKSKAASKKKNEAKLLKNSDGVKIATDKDEAPELESTCFSSALAI